MVSAHAWICPVHMGSLNYCDLIIESLFFDISIAIIALFSQKEKLFYPSLDIVY
jgi:hypothetical protein